MTQTAIASANYCPLVAALALLLVVPAVLLGADNASDTRCYELRIYDANEGKLDALNARFRDHTCKLFEKHGMTNIGYWMLDPGQAGADDTLIYLLAHKSKEARQASFKTFGGDPEWKAVREASEKDGGGSLTAKDGVKSLFLAPTDYSPLK